jgi:small subunit ribosomal protein S18
MIKKTFRRDKFTPAKPGKCSFCLTKTVPFYHDVAVLNRFVSDRGKIFSRSRSGVCAKHQRLLARAIKRARHLALLPFVNRV